MLIWICLAYLCKQAQLISITNLAYLHNKLSCDLQSVVHNAAKGKQCRLAFESRYPTLLSCTIANKSFLLITSLKFSLKVKKNLSLPEDTARQV